jgi:hypothetical protein
MRDFAAAAKDCPLAPPGDASVYSRALHRACLVLGGIEQLAKRLEVSDGDLRRWLGGEQPPEHVFLQAVEIVLLHAEGGGRAN